MQEAYPVSCQSDVRRIVKYGRLFQILICQYQVCLGCSYRILGLMNSKMYSDLKVFKKLGEQIVSSEKELMQGQGNQSFKYIVENCEQYFDESFTCWLCSGILQKSYLQELTEKIVQKVNEEFYSYKQKYKLNVKVDTMITIKFLAFLNLLWLDLSKKQIFGEEELFQLYKDVFKPQLQKNGSLEIKTVFKWVLSNTINQLQNFGLNSTIVEDENTVIIGLEVDQKSVRLENLLSKILGPLLHLNAVTTKSNKHKKVKIDLSDANYAIKWNSNIVSKIFPLGPKQWRESIEENDYLTQMKFLEQSNEKQQLLSPNLIWKTKIFTKIELFSENIYLCGKYVKFSRYLSQTPWIIHKQRLTESSLQEEVQKQVLYFFYPPEIPQETIQIKFHAGGREDIDVRMLKGGRPFVVELVNPRRSFTELKVNDILQRIEHKLPTLRKSLGIIETEGLSELQIDRIKGNLLQSLVNNSTQLAKVYQFRKTTSSYISNELKHAEIEKIKHYVCYIKSETQLKRSDKEIIEEYQNLRIVQKTPLRVLHRRTLMYRQKMVHKMIFHQVSKFSAVVEIWASAGTYIKEFVHGDMNRTLPNIGSILNKSVDILQLDVGSLKEGEWVEGAHETMKLGLLPWEKK